MSYTGTELTSSPHVPRIPGPHSPQEISVIQAEWALLQPKLDGILRDRGQAENVRYAAIGTVLQIPETMPFVDVVVVTNWALDGETKSRLESVMEATFDAELSKRTFMVYRDGKAPTALGSSSCH